MPDMAQEMLKHPALAPFAAESVGRPTYAFPVSTSQKQYGILVVTKDRGQELDVELLSSLASHVAVALECALARDRAELYQREVMKERDRLQLLLEVNNHIVSKLEVDELFQAVAASMRKHFGNDATTFWLINKQVGCLERRFLDFPTGRGFLEKVIVAVPTDFESEWWRLRTPQTYSAELEGVPATIRDAARAESLVSAVSVPLVGSDGPLGLFNMSSRTAHAFGQQDFDLLSQIGTQISLALDNALAYGRLRASNDDLQDPLPIMSRLS